ncbi:MAG: ABC transporter permease [Candidatus Hodarchaeales archaeon]
MKKLNKKLFREFRLHKFQFLGLLLICAVGVGFWGTLSTNSRNLENSILKTYEDLEFSHFQLESANPVNYTLVMEAFNELSRKNPVIKSYQLRIVTSIGLRVLVEDRWRSVEGRILAYDTRSQPAVNKFKLESGNSLDASDSGNMTFLFEKHCADFYGTVPGDWTLNVISGTKEATLTAKGIATSPEYLLLAKDLTTIIVTPRIFSVIITSLETAQSILGDSWTGMINEVSIRLEEDLEGEELQEIMNKVESAFSEIGAEVNVIRPRSEQISYIVWHEEANIARDMSIALPMLVLACGALGIYIVTSRLIRSQKRELGILMSLGYTKRELITHYAAFSLLPGLLGGIIGTIVAYFLSVFTMSMYVDVFGLPYGEASLYPDQIIIGMIVGISVTTIGGILPLNGILKLYPNEAISEAEEIEPGKLSIVERLIGVNKFRSTTKIMLRNIFRNKKRSISSITAISASVMLLITIGIIMDSFNSALYAQLNEIDTWDAQVDFTYFGIGGTLTGTENYIRGYFNDMGYSDITIERGILFPTVIHDGKGNEEFVLLNMIDFERARIKKPVIRYGGLENGSIVCTEHLAMQFGDKALLLLPKISISLLNLEVNLTLHNTTIPISGVVEELSGMSAYMDIDNFLQLAGLEGLDVATTLYIKVHGISMNNLRDFNDDVSRMPHVKTMLLEEDMNEFWTFLSQFSSIIIWIMQAACLSLAFVMIYVVVSVNVSERKREIATLRTIGYKDIQIAKLITEENLLVAAAGIIVGIPAGYIVSVYWLFPMMNTFIGVVVTIKIETIIIGIIGTILTVLLAQLPGIRQSFRLDLASATKERIS